jgi:anti-sigma B factor antagonist
MEISRVIENGITILSMSGNLLGEKDAKPILESVEISIENESNKFVIDLGDMKFINSTGLSVLLTVLTKSRNAGGDMVIINIPEQLANLLKITKLSDVFPQAASKEEAIASL